MLSEKGSLTHTPAIKLLLSVYEQNLTGILYLKQAEILKVLYFNEGKLIWAISNAEQDKLKNVLIEGTYSNELEMDKFSSDWDKDIFGKILVESGVITLEELIEVTKMQLKQIIISVLRWSEGSFQFTKDSPSQKFLSLELNIVEFVSEYIFKAMDISIIWKEIGSLQIELKQNPDGSKFKMYKLSENQSGLLKLFNGDIKLEGIISKYSGVQREIVLKTIYFFLISELLIKKGFDLEYLKIAEDEKQNTPIVETANIEYEDKADVFSDEKKQSKIENIDYEESDPEVEIETETESENYSFSDKIVNEEVQENNINEDKDFFTENDEIKKTRKVNFLLISVIIILILSGIGFILLKNTNGTVQDKDIVENPKKNKVDSIFKNDNKPEKVDKIDSATKVEEKNIKKDDISLKMEPVKESSKIKKVVKKTKTYKKLEKGKSALQYFNDGQISVAIDLWKREIKSSKIKFTILLEVACEIISVKKALSNLKSKEQFFLISRKIGRRNCFRVCWGKFLSKKDAAAALDFLPKYFFRQESPPEVITVR